MVRAQALVSNLKSGSTIRNFVTLNKLLPFQCLIFLIGRMGLRVAPTSMTVVNNQCDNICKGLGTVPGSW